jgi:hypothetical protein
LSVVSRRLRVAAADSLKVSDQARACNCLLVPVAVSAIVDEAQRMDDRLC